MRFSVCFLARPKRLTTLSALGVLVLVAALLLPGMACAPRDEMATPCRILFIGDSYTYFNDLPKIVQAIAEATHGRKILAERVTNSAFTLRHHLNDGKAVARIREGRWDMVVLQEENGVPASDPARFQHDVRVFAEEIRKIGAQPMLLMIWPPRDKPYLQAPAEKVVYGVGRNLDIRVIPVGAAWQKWLGEPNAPLLHAPDNRHPNFRGSYLTALTIVGVVRGEPVSDAPTDLRSLLIHNPAPFEPFVEPTELPRLLQCANEAQGMLPLDSNRLTLTGTLTEIAPGRLTLSVSAVTTRDGTTTALSPERSKAVLLPSGVTVPPHLQPGTRLKVVGQDNGPGTPLTARSVTVDP